MTFFSASFAAGAVTNAGGTQDLFELTAGASTRVKIHQIELGQYSEFADAQDELLSITLIRGYTTSGSGGSAATPVNFNSYGAAATSAVETINTTVASAGSPGTLYATAFNVRAGFYWKAPEVYVSRAGRTDHPIILAPSERFVVRVSVPADDITMNGTLLFEETGQYPV